MKESGKTMVTVHGRISSVAWLENAPWNAKKEHDGKFSCYRLTVGDSSLKELMEELEGVEKVWTKEYPVFEREEPHPAFSGIVAAFKANPNLEHQLQGGCYFGPVNIDNDECEEFALLQIERLKHRLESLRRVSLVQEVSQIMDDVAKRGGEAYAEYKVRLQELNKF